MILDMADSAHVPKPLRVLVSEGNSTSAREAITVLGLSGHLIEVCDPSPYCLVSCCRPTNRDFCLRAHGNGRRGASDWHKVWVQMAALPKRCFFWLLMRRPPRRHRRCS